MTDLTKITTPFGLLDAETQESLKAHGGPYEVFQTNGEWGVCLSPNWGKASAYRVKPQPREWWIVKAGFSRAVFTTHFEANRASVAVGGELIHVREVLE